MARGGWIGGNYGFGPAPTYGLLVEALPRCVAILGEDIAPLRPRLLVEDGQEVRAGETLLVDRRRPELSVSAPVSGRIAEIRRGPRRSFDRLVIETNEAAPKSFVLPAKLDRDSLTALMIEAGAWPALRTRPFERIARPEQPPEALFVTAIDTRPLAPDPAAIIAPRAAWFAAGLAALTLLSTGQTYLCHRKGAAMPQVDGVTSHGFAGGHPAGLAGTHIHKLHPVGAGGMVWHIGYQEVLALGHLLQTGTIWQRRIIGLAGDGVTAPTLLETLPGADLHDICRERLAGGAVRLLSGSPLDGRPSRFLGRGHCQVSVLRHAGNGATRHWWGEAMNWLTRGSGAIIPNSRHEGAAPPGILPIPFLRAIASGDAETAQRLGALELAEEDLALLTYVDGGTADFGRMLRRVLDMLEAGR